MTPPKASLSTLEKSLNLRDILTLGFKHKSVILAVFLVTATTATVASFLLPPTFEATSTLLIKLGREHIYRPEVGTMTPTFIVDREATINSEIRIARSPDLIRQTLEIVSVKQVYPSMAEDASIDEAVLKAQDTLSVKLDKNSNVIELTFQNQNPEVAAKFLNTLVDLLKVKHLQTFSDPNAAFLKKQLEDYKRKLEHSNAMVEQYKREHGLSSLPDERRLLLEHVKEMDAALKSAQRDLQAQRQSLNALEQQRDKTPDSISLSSISEDHHLLDGTRNTLLDLRRKEQELLTKYKDSSRFVAEIRQQIALTEAFLEEQEGQVSDRVTKGKNPVYQQMEMEIYQATANLRGLISKRQELHAQLEQLRKKLTLLDSHERTLSALELQVSTDRNNYEMYSAKAEEAGISEEMDRLKMANISVIQSAMVPVKPVKPNKPLITLAGLIIGLLTGIGLSLTREYLEGGYTRPEQLGRDLSLPILATVVLKR